MKLVRDRIPEIIEKAGKTPVYKKVEADEKMAFVAEKLVEEALELKEAILSTCEKDIIEEMADLLEVIQVAKMELQISDIILDICKQNKASERGSFINGYVLEDIEDHNA